MSDIVRLVGWQLQWLYLSSDDLIILFAPLTLASFQGFSKILATHQKNFEQQFFWSRYACNNLQMLRTNTVTKEVPPLKLKFSSSFVFVPLYAPHTLEPWYFCPRFTRCGWSFWFHKRLPRLKIKLFILAHYLAFWFELSSLDRFYVSYHWMYNTVL